MRKRVCAADELQPGEKRAVEVGRRYVVLVRAADGSFHALVDVCPHQGARLSAGPLVGDVLRCPWHNFGFDVRTGRSMLEPDRYRVKTYDVAVEDGHVIVELPS
jgi:nitrite reductase/ring-hydroxylating ferredoxin subunit